MGQAGVCFVTATKYVGILNSSPLHSLTPSLTHSHSQEANKDKPLADLERIYVDLENTSEEVDCLAFEGNVYTPGLTFESLDSAYIRLVRSLCVWERKREQETKRLFSHASPSSSLSPPPPSPQSPSALSSNFLSSNFARLCDDTRSTPTRTKSSPDAASEKQGMVVAVLAKAQATLHNCLQRSG